MLATFLTSMSLLAALQTNASPLAAPQPTAGLTSTITVTGARVDTDHLERARRAMLDGEFDLARREFTAAAALEREAGRLPIEAVTGLAHALYSQSYNRDAAFAMERLAQEAAARGDVNTEALALADAIWLNSDAGQRITARKQADRLKTIMKDAAITTATRSAVRTRVG